MIWADIFPFDPFYVGYDLSTGGPLDQVNEDVLAGAAALLAWRAGPWRRRGALALAFVVGALVTAAAALSLFGTFSPMEPPLATFCRRVVVVFFLAHALALALLVVAPWLRDRAPASPARAWYAGFVALVWPAVAVAAYL